MITQKQRDYIESLIKKVFRSEPTRSEMLSRLSKAALTSSQASTCIHALRRENNIYSSLPSSMWGAKNLNPLMDKFYDYIGFEY